MFARLSDRSALSADADHPDAFFSLLWFALYRADWRHLTALVAELPRFMDKEIFPASATGTTCCLLPVCCLLLAACCLLLAALLPCCLLLAAACCLLLATFGESLAQPACATLTRKLLSQPSRGTRPYALSRASFYWTAACRRRPWSRTYSGQSLSTNAPKT